MLCVYIFVLSQKENHKKCYTNTSSLASSLSTCLEPMFRACGLGAQ